MRTKPSRATVLCALFLMAGLSACGRGGGSFGPVGQTGPDDGPGGGSGGDPEGDPGGESDPDLRPVTRVHIGDVTALEGDTGTSSFVFDVSLSEPHEGIVTVAYHTVDGTAQGSGEPGVGDYQSAAGTLVFEPGATALTVGVLVNGNEDVEPDKVFFVQLGDVTGENVEIAGDGAGVGTIVNDDLCVVSVADVAALEGDFDFSELTFDVRLSVPHYAPITVHYQTRDGTAEHGIFDGGYFEGDYLWQRGELLFKPGVTSLPVNIVVYGDLDPEPDEYFELVLYAVDGPAVVLPEQPGRATILDDDQPVQLDLGPSTADAVAPHLAHSGQLACVVWQDDRGGDLDVYLNRSVDGGRTWLAEDVRVDRAPAGAASRAPRVCADGQDVYVVWEDLREGRPGIYFNRSKDGGLTFEDEDLRLDGGTSGFGAALRPRIACWGGRVYVVWEDHRSGIGAVRFNASLDRGVTWRSEDLRIDSGPVAASCADPELSVWGSRVYVVWSDRRNGEPDLYFNSSIDSGLTWRPADLRLDDDLPGAAASRRPRIVSDGLQVYVVWTDERDGVEAIYFNRSIDGGSTWDVSDRRLGTMLSGARRPRIAYQGNSVMVTFEDERHGQEDVYFVGSHDAGFTWTGDRRISRGFPPGAARSLAPEIEVRGQTVAIVWREYRSRGAGELYLSFSRDAGFHFLEEPVRIATSVAEGPAGASHRLAADGPDFRLVWQVEGSSQDLLFRTLRLP